MRRGFEVGPEKNGEAHSAIETMKEMMAEGVRRRNGLSCALIQTKK